MRLPPDEPTSTGAVAAWIKGRVGERDPFHDVFEATERHRAEHACGAYASGDAPLLGVIAAAIGARKVLEIGCALGYSALWLAHGSGGEVDTIEFDAAHVQLARDHVRRHGFADRIQLLEGEDRDVLPTLSGPYDLVVYDAAVRYPLLLEHFVRLLRTGGTLVSSNLFLAKYAPDLPGLEDGAEYRRLLLDDQRWTTAFAIEKAVSVLRG